MNKNIIEVENLSKSYGEIKAVDNISFCVKEGSFFAFLGQNGAGKSTTINILTGLLDGDGGKAAFGDGKSIADFKNEIGVVFQTNVFDDTLTVAENLRLYAAFYSKGCCKGGTGKRVDEIATMFGLTELLGRRFGRLSGGQKRKAEIARALLSFPKILFLDEPTTGLDPRTRAEVWDILHRVRQEWGMTLFLTTHYMEETAEADKVVIIHKGKIVCEGSPSQLRARYSFDKIIIVPKDENSFAEKLDKNGIKFKKTADYFVLRASDTTNSIDTLGLLKEDIQMFEVKKGSMDDIFLSVVGESITAESLNHDYPAGTLAGKRGGNKNA